MGFRVGVTTLPKRGNREPAPRADGEIPRFWTVCEGGGGVSFAAGSWDSRGDRPTDGGNDAVWNNVPTVEGKELCFCAPIGGK